jgi:hypothetical protein
MKKIVLIILALVASTICAYPYEWHRIPHASPYNYHPADPNDAISKLNRDLDEKAAKARAAQKIEDDKKAAEDAAKATAADTPANHLTGNYEDYQIISSCYNSRKDYLVQYISPTEMEEARTAIKGVEYYYQKQDATLDTNKIWDDSAVKSSETWSNLNSVAMPGQLGQLCKMALSGLLSRFHAIDPEAGKVKKDF